MSVVVRDKEVGTSQSDITPTSHGGPLNLPLRKMVHFNVKQSLCCVVFCSQVLVVVSKESPAQTKNRCLNCQVQSQWEVWAATAAPTRLFPWHRCVQTQPWSSGHILGALREAVRAAAIATPRWPGRRRRSAAQLCHITCRKHPNHVWIRLHDSDTTGSVWLVLKKDGSGLQPTPKPNSVDNRSTLWLLNLLLKHQQANTDSSQAQLFSLVDYITAGIC